MATQVSDAGHKTNLVAYMPQVIIPYIPITHTATGFYIKDDKILFGLRRKSSTDLGIGLFSGIGGKLEPGETASQALEREFQEEIGVKPLKYELIGKLVYIFQDQEVSSPWNQIAYFYYVSEIDGKPKTTPKTKPVFFNINNIPWYNVWIDNKMWFSLFLDRQPFYGEFIYEDVDTVIKYYIEVL